MNVKQIIKRVIILSLIVLFIPTPIIADDMDIPIEQRNIVQLENSEEVRSTTYIEDDAALAFYHQIGKKIALEYGSEIIGANFRNKVIWFDEVAFNDMEFENRQEAIKFLLGEIGNSKLSPKSKNKLYNFVQNQDLDSNKVLRNLEKDVNADLDSGISYTSFLQRPVSVTLGVLSHVMFWGLFLKLVLDVLYITLPSVQYIIDSRFGEKKYYGKIISNAARIGVIERDKDGYNPLVLLTYMRRTIVSNVIMALAFLFLIRGTIIEFIAELVSAFSG